MALEPVFSIHVCFEDGHSPLMHYGMKLGEALDILKELYTNWILIPDVGSHLDGIWNFYARPREDNGMSFPEFKESLLQDLKKDI